MSTTATSKSRLRAPLHLLTQRWTHCPWNPAGEGPQGPQEHLQNSGGAGQSSSFSPSGSFSISRSYPQPSLQDFPGGTHRLGCLSGASLLTPFLSPPSTMGQVGRQLAIIGDDINRRYDAEFQTMLEQLQPTSENAYEYFVKIAKRCPGLGGVAGACFSAPAEPWVPPVCCQFPGNLASHLLGIPDSHA